MGWLFQTLQTNNPVAPQMEITEACFKGANYYDIGKFLPFVVLNIICYSSNDNFLYFF